MFYLKSSGSYLAFPEMIYKTNGQKLAPIPSSLAVVNAQLSFTFTTIRRSDSNTALNRLSTTRSTLEISTSRSIITGPSRILLAPGAATGTLSGISIFSIPLFCLPSETPPKTPLVIIIVSTPFNLHSPIINPSDQGVVFYSFHSQDFPVLVVFLVCSWVINVISIWSPTAPSLTKPARFPL